jgi:hypothetical protein
MYLTYLLPSGANSSTVNVKTSTNTINLPPPETATNVITEGVNNAIRAAAPVANIKVNTTNQPNVLNNNNNININNNANGNGRGNKNRNPFSPPLL